MRESFPRAARITFLTSQENSELLRGFRGVNETIILDREKLRSGNPLKTVGEFSRLVYQLRAGKFSLVLDFQGYGETAWLARLTGATRRGSSFHHPRRQWAYTLSRAGDESLHAADAHLELLRRAGLRVGTIRNEFNLPPDALTEARAFFFGKPTGVWPSRPSSSKRLRAVRTRTGRWKISWKSLGITPARSSDHFWRWTSGSTVLKPQTTSSVATGVPLLVSGGLAQLSSLVLGGDTGVLHLGRG